VAKPLKKTKTNQRLYIFATLAQIIEMKTLFHNLPAYH